MCAYDTTLTDTITSGSQTPACLRRNLLDSPYFPPTSRAALGIVVVLCVVFLATSLNRLNHTDSWSHLNFGRWIVAHGALPTTDPFSADASPEPILNTPWLSQVLGYVVHRSAGIEGLIFGHALLVTLGCGILMSAIGQRRAPLAIAAVGGGCAFLLGLPVTGTLRPQLFGMVGAALTLLACAQLEKCRRPLYWLPIVFALWANLHGSFAIGIAILGCYAAGAAWDSFRNLGLAGVRRDGKVWRAWLAVLLAVAGACLNPLGVRLLIGVASFGSNAALEQITEWRALEIGSLSGVLFFSSLLATAVLLRLSPRKIETHEILLSLLMAVATLSAIRMLCWWALVWPWVVAPHVAAVWSRFRLHASAAKKGADASAPMRTVIAMGFVFMTLLIAPPSHAVVSGQSRGIAGCVSSDTPLYVADEMQRRGLTGRIYAPLDWADYLIWSRFGDVRPLTYSHVHLLSSAAWNDYLHIASGDRDWLETAQRNQLDYLVVSKARNGRLASAVLRDSRNDQPHTRLIYQDQQCMLVQLLHAGREAL